MAGCHCQLLIVASHSRSVPTSYTSSLSFPNKLRRGKDPTGNSLEARMALFCTLLSRTAAKKLCSEAVGRKSLGAFHGTANRESLFGGGDSQGGTRLQGIQRRSIARSAATDEEDGSETRPLDSVAYDSSLLNQVVVTGRLEDDPELKWLDDTLMTKLRLSMKRGAKIKKGSEHLDATYNCNAVCYGQLAEQVGNHVKSGNLVRVHGTLSNLHFPKDAIEIVVQQMYSVDESTAAVPEQRSEPESRFRSPVASRTSAAPAAKTAVAPAFLSNERIAELWDLLISSPGSFWDNRRNKRTPRSPDFVNKETKESLWLDGYRNPRNLLERVNAAGLGPIENSSSQSM